MLYKKDPDLSPRPQVRLGLFHVEKQVEYDGIEMGVLDNGVPYLSESGLARMCGIDRKVLNRLAINWLEERTKPRGKQIAEILSQSGFDEEILYLKSEHNGIEINAYTEPVCMALLEYYAFDSADKRIEAQSAYRALARVTFRNFIFAAVGYSPEQKALESWKHFHDRIDILHNAVPAGYFGVFNEAAILIVPMIRAGIFISDKVVPDISIGRAWSEYWASIDGENKYGPRIKYDHDYPEYYPQAKSNPQSPYAYPSVALGEFRDWLTQNYVTNRFPKYILNQARQGKLPHLVAQQAIEAFGVNAVERIDSAHKKQKSLPK